MAKLKRGATTIAMGDPIIWSDAQKGWIVGATVFADPLRTMSVETTPDNITRLQLILGMTQAGLISSAEGVAAAAGTAIPAVVEAVFASLPPADAVGARIRWNAMTEVERANPLVAAVAAAASKTDAEMDAYFIAWSAL